VLRWFLLWHPELIVLVLLLFGLYAYANAYVAPRRATGRQWTLFVAYLLVLYTTFGSPIDAIAQTHSFSVYIVQSLSMTLLMPWMLLTALPNWMTTAVFRVTWAYHTARVLTHPLVALGLFSVLTALFLAPIVFTANLTYNWLHTVDTIALMIAGLCLWWPLVSVSPELPQLNQAAQLVYILFGANFLMPIPFFLIASQHLWYKPYVGTAANHLNALSDQHLGGILMLVGMISVFGIRAFMMLVFPTRYAER
jgi:cytochrome c oxidase assembly factor CtaG